MKKKLTKEEIDKCEYINIGCGPVRFPNCVNMDLEDSDFTDVDVVGDLRKIPFEDGRFKGAICMHVLEHIPKAEHVGAIREMWRIVKPGGTVYIEVPDFELCLKYYLDNFQGRKEYWYMTIFGRDLYGTDRHLSGVTEQYLTDMLFDCGFHNLKWLDIDRTQAIMGVIATKRDIPDMRLK